MLIDRPQRGRHPGKSTGLFLGACLLLAGALSACLPDATRAPNAPAPEEVPPDLAKPPLDEIDGGVKVTARQLFDQQVLPALQPTCLVCHNTGGVGPAFLASAKMGTYDPYATVAGWENFVVDDPEQSLLLTRGPHEGPALNTDQYDIALRWLRQEKVERDLLAVPTHRPQSKPTVPKLKPQLNRVDLGAIDRKFAGAYVQFTATATTASKGLTLRDLRFVNVQPGSQPDDQRTIHVVRPLIVIWSAGKPQPDLSDSMATLDRSYKLNETDGGGAGVPLAALLTLPQYVAGDAISISFNELAVVGQVVSPSTCRPAGLAYFGDNVRPYIAKANACTREGCHNTTSQAASIDMSAVLTPPAGSYYYLATVCELLKFYRNNGTIVGNTDPANPLGNAHPFRWTSVECTNASLPGTCFSDFSSSLTAWAAADN
jgi:hypothetical protein